MAVHIVTDSAGSLPPELASELGIKPISLYYGLGDGKLKRELDLADLGGFYEELVESRATPHTAPASEEDFVALYRPLLADGGSVVSVHVSSVMSDTCAHARAAAERLAAEGAGGERVHVVDSAGAGAKMALVALAARAGANGGDPEAAVRHAADSRQEAQMRILLDTLEFLRRGGRIGTAAAWLGSALDIKPILSVGSELKAVERVRTPERGQERLVEFGRRLVAAGADAWALNHAHASEAVDSLADRLQEVFWRPPEFIAELGPVMGAHTGPGMIGLAAIPSRFLE